MSETRLFLFCSSPCVVFCIWGTSGQVEVEVKKDVRISALSVELEQKSSSL